jgi:F-type H+-transporting ATPase subunit b
MDASFSVLLSFILFMAIAFRVGYRKSMATLDDKIDDIRKKLEEATQAKESALALLHTERKHQAEILVEAQNIIRKAQQEVDDMKHQALHELEALLEKRQGSAYETLNRIRLDTIDEIRQHVTLLIIKSIEELSKTLTEEQHEILNNQALNQIITEIQSLKKTNVSINSLAETTCTTLSA